MRVLAFSWRRSLLILFLASIHGWPVHAGERVIGIVFDDSGSMAPWVNLPAYGVQLLVSSLKSQSKADRLFTIELSDQEPVERDISTFENQRAVIKEIANEWTKIIPDTPTPYLPLEKMLETLVNQTGPDAEAYLVVVTDGKFTIPVDGAFSPEDLLVRYKSFRDRLKGKLRVDFVLISSDLDQSRLQKIVEKQGVRSGLLRVFNRDVTDGQYDVSSSDAVSSAMIDIITRINSTHRQATLVQTGDGSISIDTPISVSRLVSVLDGPTQTDVPAVTTVTPVPQEQWSLESEMKSPDRAERWRGERLWARSTHMVYSSPTPAGKLRLTYDSALAKLPLLLFETPAKFELSIFDDGGQQIGPNDDGVIELSQNGNYLVAGAIIDPTLGSGDLSLSRVNPTALPTATKVSIWHDRNGQRQRIEKLTVDPKSHLYIGHSPTSDIGTFAIGGVLSVPGFVRLESNLLKIKVVHAPLRFSHQLIADKTSSNCSREPTFAGAYRSADVAETFATYVLTSASSRSSRIGLRIAEGPAWLQLAWPDGREISESERFTIPADGKLDILLRRLPGVPVSRETIGGRTGFKIEIVTDSTLAFDGQREYSGSLCIAPPDLEIRFAGLSVAPDDISRLIVTQEELERQNLSLIFDILEKETGSPFEPNALDGSGSAEAYSLTAEPTDQSYVAHARVKGSKIYVDLSINSDICLLCIQMWFREILRNAVNSVYVNLNWPPAAETVTGRGDFEFRPTVMNIVFNCGLYFLGMIFSLYLLFVLRAFVSSKRFPRNSVAEILDSNSRLPRMEELRQGSNRLWRCLFCKKGHDQRSIEGVFLEAAPEGAHLVLDSSDSAVFVEKSGQTVSDLQNDMPSLETIMLYWGDELSAPRGFRSLRLRRDFNEE